MVEIRTSRVTPGTRGSPGRRGIKIKSTAPLKAARQLSPHQVSAVARPVPEGFYSIRQSVRQPGNATALTVITSGRPGTEGPGAA
jgi:hypothetical protein